MGDIYAIRQITAGFGWCLQGEHETLEAVLEVMKTQGYSLEEQRYELAADLMNQSRQTATFKANGEKSVDFKVANVRRFAVSEKRLRKAKIKAFEASDVVTRVDVV